MVFIVTENGFHFSVLFFNILSIIYRKAFIFSMLILYLATLNSLLILIMFSLDFQGNLFFLI